jgi:tetratricopeptide (TPR) repeat protein
MMQTYFLNFLKIFSIFLLLIIQLTDSQAQRSLNKKADSLFIQKKNDEAIIVYEQILKNTQNINPNIYLKLANIFENKGEFVKELYYLNLYFFKEPNEKVFEKMYTIASENGFKGYEKNDLNYILFYYRQYANYIWGLFLILGLYIFVVLVSKKRKKQFSPIRHKIIFIIYLIFLGSLINLPNNYRSAIIKNDKVYLRDYPSAASQIVGYINAGNRLNIIKADDIWYQVLWEGQFCYIKSSDIWLVK